MAKAKAANAEVSAKGNARESGTARFAPPQGAQSLASVADKLKVSYIKAEELAEAGSFYLLSGGVRVRTMAGKTSEEVAFEVQIARDGEVFFFTPQNNATRTRMLEVLKVGPVGPLTLIQGEAKAGQSAPWLFADENGKPAY